MLAFIKIFGPVFWPLLICSIVAITICIERSTFFFRQYKSKETLYSKLAETLTKYSSQPKPMRDEALNIKVSELQRSFHSGLSLLRLIGSLSPMLGLLGTILGVIRAFQSIAEHVGPVAPNIIAGGLWEAMLTTSLGMMISLPCIFMAYIFRGIAGHGLNHLCFRLNKLSLSMEMENKKII